MSHGVSTAAHAVRAGDSRGGGHSVDLSEKESDVTFKRPSVRYGRTPEPETPYQKAAQVWDERIGSARVQAKNWRLMAFGSLFLSAGLAFGLVWQSARGTIVPWVVQVDKLGEAHGDRASRLPIISRRSADRLVSRAFHRRRPLDHGRSRHRPPELAARLRFTTTSGPRAQRLCPCRRSFRQTRQAADRGRCLERHRASPISFRVAWIQHRYQDGSLAETERWTAILTVVIQPRTMPSACARIRSASTSPPSIGRRSWDNEASFRRSHVVRFRRTATCRLCCSLPFTPLLAGMRSPVRSNHAARYLL